MQRTTIRAIQEVIRKPAGKFRLTKVLNLIHDEYSIGTISGRNSINFSHEDMAKLRELVEASHIIDPMHASLELPREKLAEISNDEKLTNVSVFNDLILLARRLNQTICTSHGGGVTPPYSLLSVPFEFLNITQEETIVVIENGAVIKSWTKIILPPDMEDVVFVYRGHGQSASNVKDIVQGHPEEKKYAYFDFDPSGLSKAVTLGLSNLIIPSNWKEIHKSKVFEFNKRDIFWKQQQDLEFLLSHESTVIRDIAIYMQKYNIALTQEHLTAHGISLSIA